MVKFQPSGICYVIFNRYCLLVCIVTAIILVIVNQIVNPPIEIKYQHCDTKRIQEHYMNNLSFHNLLRSKPVRSNPFEYEIINDQFCGKDVTDIDLLIFIISKSHSYERRDAIRRTYGNINNVFKYVHDKATELDVRILFVINMDEAHLKSIAFEQRAFNDIVQLKIPDEYLMKTYQDFSILDWSSKYCRNARTVLRMHDTIFLNPFLLLKFINENENDRLNLELRLPLDIDMNCPKLDPRLSLLYGFVQSDEHVSRDKIKYNKQTEKFVISKEEYPCDIYPDYLNDYIYLITSDARDLIVCALYRQSKALLPISNIYITGILAKYLNIRHEPIANYQANFNSRISCEKFITKVNASQAFACLTSDEMSKTVFEHYHIYWQALLDYQIGNVGK